MMALEITQIYQAINAVSERVNDINKRLNDLINMVNNQKQSDIDFIAMETGVELDQEDEEDGTF